MGRQIRVRHMNNTEFKIDVEDSETIAQVKNKIEAQEKYPIDQQTIIFSGKVKGNDETIGSLNIKETDFFVIMIRKPKTPSASTSTTTTTTPTTSTTPAPTTSTPSTSTSTSTTTPTTSTTPAPTTPTPAPTAAPTGGVTADPTLVQSLIEMGFPKDIAELALKVTHNDISAAAALVSENPNFPEGIPSELLNMASQPASTGQSNPLSQATPSSPQASPVPTTSSPSSGGTGSVFDPLRSMPQFSHLRFLVQQNPELLQPILGQLAQENPNLLQLINQHQQEFLDLLKEPVDPAHLQSLPQGLGAQQIRVTPEEKEAIDRLEQLVQGMGIDRSTVIATYFSCDKDEQLAANQLLEGNFDD